MRSLPLESIEQIQSEIVGKCTQCKGLGVLIKAGEVQTKVQSCPCTRQAYLEVRYQEADIPARVRRFDKRNLTKSFRTENQKSLTELQQYLNDLPTHLQNGQGLYLYSGPGLAKTALSGYLLKEAIKAGYTGYFIRASKLAQWCFEKMSDDSVAADLTELTSGKIKLVVIDEIDRIYMRKDPSAFLPQAINEVFGYFYDNLVSLIVTSNCAFEDLSRLDRFEDNIIDRLAELVRVPFQGQSHRLTRSEDIL